MMKKAIISFYSILATLLILEFLITLCSVIIPGKSIYTSDIFFTNDNVVLRSLLLAVCALSLGQVYLLHIRGRKLGATAYWLLLGLNSAGTVYLTYSNDIIHSSYATLNAVLVSISFFVWAMFLLLGVMYKSVSLRSA